jgi:DNA-binding NarL/FixJ family response regulator
MRNLGAAVDSTFVRSAAMLSSPVRILIVDDHPVTRQGLAALVAVQKDMMICGEADGVANALKAVADMKPDIVIVDIRLKDGDGIVLVKQLKD